MIEWKFIGALDLLLTSKCRGFCPPENMSQERTLFARGNITASYFACWSQRHFNELEKKMALFFNPFFLFAVSLRKVLIVNISICCKTIFSRKFTNVHRNWLQLYHRVFVIYVGRKLRWDEKFEYHCWIMRKRGGVGHKGHSKVAGIWFLIRGAGRQHSDAKRGRGGGCGGVG